MSVKYEENGEIIEKLVLADFQGNKVFDMQGNPIDNELQSLITEQISRSRNWKIDIPDFSSVLKKKDLFKNVGNK